MGVEAAIILVGCIVPLVTFLGAIMWCQFQWEERHSTRRLGARPGQQSGEKSEPFRASSQIKKWNRSDDMLDNGTHSNKEE